MRDPVVWLCVLGIVIAVLFIVSQLNRPPGGGFG